MTQSNLPAINQLDQWLRQAHNELVESLAPVLDIEAGLREVLGRGSLRFSLKDEPAPDVNASQDFFGSLMDVLDHALRQIPPLVPSSPFPTPGEVDARWKAKLKAAYESLVRLVNEKLNEEPRGVYSVEIPQGTHQSVVRRVCGELERTGWCTSSSKALIRFYRAAR